MKKLAKIGTSVSLLAMSINPAFAADPGLGIEKPDNFAIENIGALISSVIGVALILAGILVFAMLVWGGVQWIMSGGDKAKTEEARNRITAALVGLAIVASAWAIMKLVEYFFGLNIQDPQIVQPF